MSYLPDEDLISCHAAQNLGKVVWKKDRCSHCGSIRPSTFIQELYGEGLIAGWTYGKSGPISCETTAGTFYSAHLNDTSDNWLKAHQFDIARATGVLFTWRNERLRYKVFGPRKARSSSDPVNTTLQAKIRLFIEKNK